MPPSSIFINLHLDEKYRRKECLERFLKCKECENFNKCYELFEKCNKNEKLKSLFFKNG